LKVPATFAHCFRLTLVVLWLCGLAACSAGPSAKTGSKAAAGTPVTIKLIALNDFHGHLRPLPSTTALPAAEPGKTVDIPLGGAAYVATEVRALKAQNGLNMVVGAGDLISASPLESSLFHDESTILALDAMGLEISSVGNHEFDRGRDALLRMQNGGCAPDGSIGKDTCIDGPYRGASFRYLAANVVDEASGKPILPAYAIREFATPAGPVRIAFIGLVLKALPDMVSHSGIEGLRLDDEADTVNALLPEIRAKGINSIVVLIHEGGKSTGSYNDQECPGFTGKIIDIVGRLDPAVSLVLSAHTHEAYVCRLASRDPAHKILVTSSGSYGRFVTDVDLSIDPVTDQVLTANANNIAIVNDSMKNPAPTLYPALTADPTISAIVDEYSKLAAPVDNRIIGRIRTELSNKADKAGESPLGFVIADAQLEATHAKANGGAQIAFMNIGGVRSGLKRHNAKGGVNYGQIYSAQPFGTPLTTMTLTGAQLHDVLEAQWHEDSTSAILLPSRGFSYTWKADAPLGSKVDPDSMKLNGKPVKSDATYRITVNDFLADGGDAFKTFKEGTERRAFKQLDRDVLITYVARHSPLAAPARGRIKRLD